MMPPADDAPELISAGDAKAWFYCARRAWLDHRLPGDVVEDGAFDRLLRELGEAHEARVRARLEPVAEADGAAHTRALIRAGAPVIFQPVFVDAKLGVVGRPDFLIRTADGDYQVADAKLALSVAGSDKRALLAQVGLYRRLAGTGLPARLYLGDGSTVEVAETADRAAATFLTGIRATLAEVEMPDVGFSESRCRACPYDRHCRPRFEAARHPTLVYGVQARAADGLRAQGIDTVTDLAAADPERIADVPFLKGDRKRRAVLQARSLETGEVLHTGPIRLPPGEYVHFDVESNPFGGPDGTEVYLWGLLEPPFDGSSYRHSWSDGGRAADAAAWREFIAEAARIKRRYRSPRFVHYSRYERTQIRAYAERHAMTGDPTVTWLLGDDSPLLDLRDVVRDALVLPVTGYGLKSICKDPRLVNFQWSLEESGSQWSVVRYAHYRLSEVPAERARIRDEIVGYNRDDVRATRALELWLRALAGSDEGQPG